MPTNTTATLGDVQHNTIRHLLGTFCNGACDFDIDENANDVEINVAFDYFIKGIGYPKATDAAVDISAEVTNLASITAAGTLAAGYTQVFVFEIGTAGAFTVSAGDQVLTADITAGTKTAHWPAPTSDDVCPFAAVKVAATAEFTFGTTALTTIGTFYDLCRVPASF